MSLKRKKKKSALLLSVGGERNIDNHKGGKSGHRKQTFYPKKFKVLARKKKPLPGKIWSDPFTFKKKKVLSSPSNYREKGIEKTKHNNENPWGKEKNKTAHYVRKEVVKLGGGRGRGSHR